LSQIRGVINSQTASEPDPNSPTGITDTLTVLGGNPALRPESSKSYTTGLDITPQSLPQLTLSATYYHITFKDRISTPNGLSTLNINDPALAPFINRNPTLETVNAYFNSPAFVGDFYQAGPASVQAIFNNQVANIETTRQSGADFSAAYPIRSRNGDFSLSLAGTRILKNDVQAVPNGASFPLLNTFSEPTAWKVRGGLGWAKGNFTSVLNVNYVNSYANSQFTPAPPIASWTTADVFLSYRTGRGSSAYLARNLTFALSVQNIAGRAPPYVAGYPNNFTPGQHPIPFDAANASPVGRSIALQLRKQW